MGFKCPIEKHVKKGMMVQTLQDGIFMLSICCPISCSNGRKHTRAGGGKKSHVALRCCWKGNVLLSTHVKALRRKGQ
jgi:hypothetical protein